MGEGFTSGYPQAQSSILPALKLLLLLLVFLVRAQSYADVWRSKCLGKDGSNQRLTEWMKEGALPDKHHFIPRSGEKSLRKEYRTLSPTERRRFHGCLLKLKETPALGEEGLSEYDTFVIHHTFDYSPEAHDSPCFLPFHRVFLYILERLMRSHEGCHDMALHYWDTTLDAMLPDPSQTVIFNHPDYMGNGNGTVDTGFLKDWGPVVPEQCQKYGVNLTRSVCDIQYALLLNQEVDTFVHCGRFEDCVFPKDRRFEDAHGQVHNCVGGHMVDLLCAPNDPIFFMYHSFVDLVFQEYIEYNYPRNIGIDPTEDYPKVTTKDFWMAKSSMLPFSEFKVIDGLSRNFSDNLVAYEPRPRRCQSHNDCTRGRSDALWCDIRVGQCMAKVYLNGNCEGLSDDACFSDCKYNEAVFCDKSDFTCQCEVTSCYSDNECVAEDELCDLPTNTCKKRLSIGEFCGSLTDRFCGGVCPGLNDVLKCVSGKCSCELTAIRCQPDDEVDMCPRGLYCDSAGLCKMKVKRGEACGEDRMCQSRCYQGYTGFCSRTQLKCQCILKVRLREMRRRNPPHSNTIDPKSSFTKPTQKPSNASYCKSEAECADDRQLCLRKRYRKDPFQIRKQCFFVSCSEDADCRRKGIWKVRCQSRLCVRL